MLRLGTEGIREVGLLEAGLELSAINHRIFRKYGRYRSLRFLISSSTTNKKLINDQILAKNAINNFLVEEALIYRMT